MNIKTLIGNRLIIQRLQFTPDGQEAITIPTAINTEMMRRETTFECEVVMLGTGRKLAEKQPEIKVGSRLICNNQTGTIKLDDGREVISGLDVLAIKDFVEALE